MRVAAGLLLVLLAAPRLQAQGSGWTRIGDRGEWGDHPLVVGLQSRFWWVSGDGSLEYTNPWDNYTRQLGSAGSYNGTTLLATGKDGDLYNVQQGTLYVTHVGPGSWSQIGAKGDWAHTKLLAVTEAYLWSIEEGGSFYKTDMDGHFVRVGKEGERRLAQYLEALDGRLYALELGTLYALTPGQDSWQRLSDYAESAGAKAFTAAEGYLWHVEEDGNLYRTDPADGKWIRVGEVGAYRGVTKLLAVDGQLYAIKDGTMYKTMGLR
jgi:hypothetical protein